MALDAAAMDTLLHTHQIPAPYLRADDFDGFYKARKALLLELIEQAMGKAPSVLTEARSDDREEMLDEETYKVQAADA